MATEDGSNPFGIEDIRRCVAPLSSRPPGVFGVDLARSVDWTVIVGLDDAGATCRFERFQRPWGETTEAVAKAVGQRKAYVDSTGVGDPIVEELVRAKNGYGLRNVDGYKFTQQSKQQLMEGLAVAIQNQTVAFPDGPIKQELEDFEFVYTRTGAIYAAPEGLHDDCVMALALAVRRRGSAARGSEPRIRAV